MSVTGTTYQTIDIRFDPEMVLFRQELKDEEQQKASAAFPNLSPAEALTKYQDSRCKWTSILPKSELSWKYFSIFGFDITFGTIYPHLNKISGITMKCRHGKEDDDRR